MEHDFLFFSVSVIESGEYERVSTTPEMLILVQGRRGAYFTHDERHIFTHDITVVLGFYHSFQ